MTERLDWIVRRDTVDVIRGQRVVKTRYLVKWSADIDRLYCNSCWTHDPKDATRWDEDGARFAASLVGGWPMPAPVNPPEIPDSSSSGGGT